MSNILVDIVDDVQLKPSMMKLVLKWVISISLSTIVVAFTFGQIKAMRMNKLDNFERILDENTAALIDIKTEMKVGFDNINTRIDKVYDDGFKVFNDFQIYNNKQLGMIIDYGKSDKEMLKRMLEITSMEKINAVENQIQQAKVEEPTALSIRVTPANRNPVTTQYKSLSYIVALGSKDTTFHLMGATKEYIGNIDKNKYQLGAIIESFNFPGLFDVKYVNKK